MTRLTEDYFKGYKEGYKEGLQDGQEFESRFHSVPISEFRDKAGLSSRKDELFVTKRKQSPKQKLLSKMTDKKWNVYKKGSGKKTYFEIRAQVSKSQDYKKKAKRL